MNEMNRHVNDVAWREEWIAVGEAAQELRVAPGKLSKLIAQGYLKTKKDPLDGRKVLIQRLQVYELFRRSPVVSPAYKGLEEG